MAGCRERVIKLNKNGRGLMKPLGSFLPVNWHLWYGIVAIQLVRSCVGGNSLAWDEGGRKEGTSEMWWVFVSVQGVRKWWR